jgi:hypothetical protein
MPVQNGKFAYYPRYLDDTYGRTDIYRLEIYSSTHPRKFRISGMLGISDLGTVTSPIRIAVIEQFSRDTVAYSIADPNTGAYEFIVPRGKYDMRIEGEGIETETFAFEIPEDYFEKEMEITRNILLSQVKKLEDLEPRVVDNIIAEDTLILVSTDDPVVIALELEKNAHLFMHTWHDSLHFSSDTFLVEKEQFFHLYTPVPGKNLLKFKMQDSLNRLSFKDIMVIYTPVALPEPVAEAIDTIVQEETVSLQSELMEMSSGALQEMLGGLDLAAEGIVTEEDLLNYLLSRADEYNYDAQDVYDMIRKKMQVDYLQSYQNELIRLTDDENLRKALLDLDLAGEDINTLQDMYETILKQADNYGYEGEQVNELFSLLSQREELNELIKDLEAIAGGGLQTALSELNAEEADIQNPVDLMSYLLDRAGDYGYSPEEAMSLLLEYMEEEDVKDILRALVANTTGDLQTLLMNLDLEMEGIRTLADLYQYLIEQSLLSDFSDVDVMKAFLNVLDVLENQPLVSQIEVPDTTWEERQRAGGTWQFYVLGGILLLIILFFIGRRRKKTDGVKNH